jgi:hypothetical protein
LKTAGLPREHGPRAEANRSFGRATPPAWYFSASFHHVYFWLRSKPAVERTGDPALAKPARPTSDRPVSITAPL